MKDVYVVAYLRKQNESYYIRIGTLQRFSHLLSFSFQKLISFLKVQLYSVGLDLWQSANEIVVAGPLADPSLFDVAKYSVLFLSLLLLMIFVVMLMVAS